MNSPTDAQWDSLSDRIATKFVPPQLRGIEDWRVIRDLGSGSTAHVWLMQHETRTQFMACKTPKTHQNAATLSQEAQLAGALTHPNLVALGEPCPESSSAGVTFWEFLPAGSLANLVAATGGLSVAKTVTVLWPMVQVAQYLHSQQIVHGDISPRNILFDLTGRPVLIDLGASRATAHSYTLTGTPGFVAPEMAGGRVEGLGAAADVYSLGAVGWFCLTGMIPGPTHSRVPLVTLNADLDADIVELLEASLSEEPALRPSLDQLVGSVPYWAEPESVDLFPAVGEEYELHLPTRKPSVLQKPKRRMFKRGRGRRPRVLQTSNAKPVLDARLSQRWTFLAAGALALAVGVVLTATQGSPGHELHTGDSHTSEQTEDTGGIDFQSVIDTLARARSAAWASSDPSLVDEYAIPESEIYTEDQAVLEALAATEHTLDGIRMRAVVQATEQTDEDASVAVEWRMDGYTQRDASGEVVEEFDQRVDTIDMTLGETADGWKIAEVEAH